MKLKIAAAVAVATTAYIVKKLGGSDAGSLLEFKQTLALWHNRVKKLVEKVNTKESAFALGFTLGATCKKKPEPLWGVLTKHLVEARLTPDLVTSFQTGWEKGSN